MSSYLPVTLQGANLGERHRYLNSLVNQAFTENVPINEIISIPERSAICRLFKIDLASKYRYLEYILQNLKDDDMLYVSRCFKCLWLLESGYRDIICPSHLNNVLYPEMIKPAVNKMKHWLKINLKDAERCQEFYNYYKSNIEEAISFFWHCSNEFILSEFPNIVDKLTPVQMRILVETCPSAFTLYFDILPSNRLALTRYVNDETNYFMCIRYLLKHDGNSFLDLVEKYFNTLKFSPFGPSITEIIMKKYKSRVLTKAELYFPSILHKKTFAAHLTSDEAKDLVLQLARAEYISYWLTFQNVEALIKRVNITERALLKKQVFVDKTIGSTVAEWPYPVPKPLVLNEESDKCLLDVYHHPHEYIFHERFMCCQKIMKRKYAKYDRYDIFSAEKSLLDKLFNRYRFTGFEATFRELSKKILAETTVEGRMNMMLVLVSKSGGISAQVEKLLKFLVEKHKNETNTLRAAVIRSLVKRERVWAVEEKPWEYLLEFGRDLGLDGSNTELVCREGLHAVIIRHLLHDTPISETLLAGFLRDFSTLSEYKLNVDEKTLISKRLPPLLMSSNPIGFLDVIDEYKLSIKEFPDAVPFLVKAANDDTNLVYRLYKARILRRELFHKTFTLHQTNAMYLNALRHDVKPLESGKSFTSLASSQRPNHDKFLHSLSLFFSEPGGLADQHRNSLEVALAGEPKSWMVRPLCMLWSTELLLKRISDLSKTEKGKKKDEVKSKMLFEFKSNAHKSKPTLNIDVVDWQKVGAKVVANKVFVCRNKDQERYLKKLSGSKRTAKISLRLASKTPFVVDNYLRVYTLRPKAALDFGFSVFFKETIIDESIWGAMKYLIDNTQNLSNNRHLLKILEDNATVPKNIESDYWVFVYNTLVRINFKKATPMLCRLENLLPQVDQTVMKNIINDFITNDLNVDNFVKNSKIHNIRSLYFRIIAKILLFCKSDDEQKDLLENICDKFFNSLEELLKSEESKKNVLQCLNDFIFSLKYIKAFVGEYVTIIPVFERVLKRLHNLLPVEENFNKYAEIHLTMLFYKSVKQLSKLQSFPPEDSKLCNENVEIVGKIFGKYVGYEIKELVSKYFKSVVHIYKKVLKDYLRNYFKFNDGRSLFVTHVVKGILEAGTTEALLLAEHIFNKEHKYHIAEPHRDEILKVLKEANDEVKYFFCADFLC
ncbi:uncharacterized protein LOC123667603 [Melitaea cinxia]|uniref:uncharacterized protein LOC123667603 n=1 Tax=Melitaea cinxia TaxID=113334 RepID=UPI001E26EE90|nr:uncharacterized protein LOC123667603 [Melitaea cinxia]